MYEKVFLAYRLSQLIGHCLITVLASARPCTLFYCITVKQAFGNLGLLAGYGAKPIGPGLGRDRVVSERYLSRVIPHTRVQMSYRVS